MIIDTVRLPSLGYPREGCIKGSLILGKFYDNYSHICIPVTYYDIGTLLVFVINKNSKTTTTGPANKNCNIIYNYSYIHILY